MKKGIKIAIIITCVIIAICIVILLFLISGNSTRNDNIEIEETSHIYDNISQYKEEEIKKEVITKVDNNDIYYTLMNALDVFAKYIRKNDKDAILSYIDEEYIKLNKISDENILDYVKYVGSYQKFYAYEIYKEYASVDIIKYYLRGKLSVGYNKEENIDVWYVIKEDTTNNTFSIIPYYENEKSLLQIEEVKEKFNQFSGNNNINDYNYIENKLANDEYMAKEYFYNFQYRILYDYKDFYSYLDEEYRNKRFDSINDYAKYIKDNYDSLANLTLNSYQVEEKLDYIEYICLDNKNTYYTIKVTGLMDYTILLDDYTILTDEFVKVYDNSKDEEKVYTCIEIFIKMLNNKDYNAAYKTLDETFRENEFGSVDEFEEFAREKFFDYMIIENIENFKKTGVYYVCDIDTASGINLASNKDKETFIIFLGEKTEFKLSFNIEK